MQYLRLGSDLIKSLASCSRNSASFKALLSSILYEIDMVEPSMQKSEVKTAFWMELVGLFLMAGRAVFRQFVDVELVGLLSRF